MLASTAGHQSGPVLASNPGSILASAEGHVDTLLALSPTRLWVRDLGMRLLPQAWLGRAFGKQFDAERALVEEILGAAA